MQIRTMRWLDRWLGTPLCLALTAIRRLTDAGRRLVGMRPRKDPALSSWHRPPAVLFVKLAEMGSTVLALPAIQRLRRQAPGARLHYLCFAENRSVLDLLPGIDWAGIHTIRTTSILTFACDTVRIIWRLRRLRLDAAIDLEILTRASALLVYLSGAPVRVGFHRFAAEGLNCGDLYTHRLTYNHHLHTAGAFLALVEALAAPPGQVPMLKHPIQPPAGLPPFEPTPAERQALLARLVAGGYPAGTRPPLIILNTNASDLLPLRRWPMEYFLDLARRCLSDHPDAWIVLTGSPGEAARAAELERNLGAARVINMAGRTTLRELVTLYTLCDLMVTNDSGPVHFASLTRLPTVALFGPETPELYGPLNPAARTVTAGLACSPCIHVFNARESPCRDNQCMKQITVDQVYREVRALLSTRLRAPERGEEATIPPVPPASPPAT